MKSSLEKDSGSWDSWSSLMKKVQAGDQEAYRLLLDEIGPLLYGFVRRRVYDRDLVADVYQDLLLKFHRVYPTYECGRPFGPWLFVVARHSILNSLDKYRRIRKHEVPSDKLPEPEPASRDEGGMNEALAAALEALPPLSRAAITLLKLEGLSLQEAALRLEITVPALKTRAHRAYVQLRQTLKKGM